MRSVARFQFYSDENVSEAYESALSILKEWAEHKFEINIEGKYRIKKRNRPADFREMSDSTSEGRRAIFISKEISGESIIEMETAMLEYKNQVFFQSSLRAGAADSSFIEPSISVRAPRFVQNLLNCGVPWRSAHGADRVFSRQFRVGVNEYSQFEELLVSSYRYLPLVLISEGEDGLEIQDIDEKIRWSCCGLAHVCRITPDASWLLTESLGKEWSCYNGAIRYYWPNINKRSNPWLHKLWTQGALRKISTSTRMPSDIIVSKVCGPIFEASCYLPLADEFNEYDKIIVNRRFELLRRSAQDAGDEKALAQLYADENEELKKIRDDLILENKSLKENINALIKFKIEDNQQNLDLSAATFAPPQTAREAVEAAMERFADRLKFSDDVEDQIESMRADAGPPESILHHLQVLFDLSLELKRRKGRIGDTLVNWLRGKGLSCSGESETKKGAGLFKFSVEGIYEGYELHLKVNDNVFPDRCIRIYFSPSDNHDNIKVGYVGSKRLLM